MEKKGFLYTGAYIVAIIMSLVALYEYTLIREQKEIIARNEQETRRLRSETSANKQKADSRPPLPAAAQAPLQSEQANSETASPKALARRAYEAARQQAKAKSEVVGDPGLQQLLFQQAQARIPLEYGPLFARLGLNSTQTEAFRDILEKRFWAISDFTTSAARQDLSKDDPAFEKLYREAVAPFDDAVKTLVGEEGYKSYRQYETNYPVRSLVEEVAGVASLAGSGLSREEAQRLESILATHTTLPPNTKSSWLIGATYGNAGPTPRAGWKDIDWDAATPQLQSLLSPAQQSLIDSLRRQSAAKSAADKLQNTLMQTALRAPEPNPSQEQHPGK